MFYAKSLLFLYQFATFVFWLFASIFVRKIDLSRPKRANETIKVRLNNKDRECKFYEIYIAAADAEPNIRETLKKLTSQTMKKEQVESRIKPDTATLISCAPLVRHRSVRQYEAYKRGMVITPSDYTIKVVEGKYVLVNHIEQARDIIRACNSPDLDPTDIFEKTAGTYGKVESFIAPEAAMPFAEWIPQINEQIKTQPVYTCLGPFILAREGKVLVFILTKRIDYIQRSADSELVKIREFYNTQVRDNENEFLRSGILTYPTNGEIFAIAKIKAPSGKMISIPFTQTDFRDFQFALSDKMELTPQDWSIMFKRAIVLWIIAHTEGLLDRDFRYAWSINQLYIQAKKLLNADIDKTAKAGVAFKVTAFVFESNVIVQRVINYLHFLQNEGATNKELLLTLENAAKDIGSFIKKSQVIALEKVLDLAGNPKTVDDILPGDLVLKENICQSIDDSLSKSPVVEMGAAKPRYIICHVQERVSCSKMPKKLT